MPTPIDIRPIVREHFERVLDIEQRAFEADAWNLNHLEHFLTVPNCTARVAVAGRVVLGYVFYQMKPYSLFIANIAVDYECRRKGIGSMLVDYLKDNLSPNKRVRMETVVRETNVEAQLFFKAQGMQAVNTKRDYYDRVSDAAYVMRYAVPSEERQVG